MKPTRLPANAIAQIQRLHDPKRLTALFTKCAMTSDQRKAIIAKAQEMSVELPINDVTYV